LPRLRRRKATPRRARSRTSCGRSGAALPTLSPRSCWRSRAKHSCASITPRRSFTTRRWHAPQFAEGWNELGYVYFLAGDYDASLDAIEHVLALEPMHYAALAGKGIILFYTGKAAEAQAPLQRALAIDPWLKERNLIGKDLVPTP
jgi:tetratricopeptide (TPR) repeat protein